MAVTKRFGAFIVGVAALLGAAVGWLAGEATIPPKEFVREAVRALVAEGSKPRQAV